MTTITDTSNVRISARQLEVLKILGRKTQPVEWSSVWDSCSWVGVLSGTLARTNFGRVCDALTRKGMVAMDTDNFVSVTERGRLALRLAGARILKVSP